MSQLVEQDADTSMRWVDPDPLDASWAPPSPAARLPRWVRILIPTALLALLTGIVWQLGGFTTERRPWVAVPLGTVQSAGPLDVVWTDAVATKYDDHWSVSVFGRCRFTAETGERYLNLAANASFLVADLDGDVLSYGLFSVDNSDATNSRDTLSPGTGWYQCRTISEKDIPLSFVPTDHITVGVQNLQYSDITVTQSGEKSWNGVSGGTKVYVPMSVQDLT